MGAPPQFELFSNWERFFSHKLYSNWQQASHGDGPLVRQYTDEYNNPWLTDSKISQ